MKSLSRFLFLLFLILPTFNLSAQTYSSLEASFNAVLNKKTELIQKEAFVKLVSARVQAKIKALLEQGKSSDDLTSLVDIVNKTSLLFPLPKEADVADLDANLRTGKVTLQARVNGPTPIFYTGSLHDIFGGATGTGLMLDDYNQIDPLEAVALSGTTFQIMGVMLDHGNVIYQVTTPDYAYPTDTGYFIDARFMDVVWMPLGTLVQREKHMPSKETILSNLRNSLGLPYIWGGNVPTGVPKLLEYYAPQGLVSEELRAKWTFRGVDCSGLLYAATEGSTPRNTSTIVISGTGIDIVGRTGAEIIPMLQPLDVIAWKGHMMIILNKDEVIQSRADYGTGTLGFQNGVKISSLKEVLNELIASRVAVNSINDTVPEGKKKFVIRRWY